MENNKLLERRKNNFYLTFSRVKGKEKKYGWNRDVCLSIDTSGKAFIFICAFEVDESGQSVCQPARGK
jgi:hypothetical protein